MSIVYFDGMNQYADVPAPAMGSPIQLVPATLTSALTDVPSDPSVFVMDTSRTTFCRHLNDDRTYAHISRYPQTTGISYMWNPTTGVAMASQTASTNTYSLPSSAYGFEFVNKQNVGLTKSLTIGYKLKLSTNSPTSMHLLGAFSGGNWLSETHAFGICLLPSTNEVYIRKIVRPAALSATFNAAFPSGTFVDDQSQVLGTCNFVSGLCTGSGSLSPTNGVSVPPVQDLAPNTVEITIFDNGRVSVWINNIFVGSIVFNDDTVTKGIYIAKIGLAQQRGTFNGSTTGYTMIMFNGISDFYMSNGLGTRNTSRLGKVRVVTRTPKQDVSVQFTRPDNVNFNSDVAGQLPAKVTPALVGLKAGDKDIYASNAFNFTNETIIATAVTTTGYKTDPTGNDIAPVLRVVGRDFVGANNAVPVSPTTMRSAQHIYEVNPVTNAVFTKADLDATQFGVVVVAPLV